MGNYLSLFRKIYYQLEEIKSLLKMEVIEEFYSNFDFHQFIEIIHISKQWHKFIYL